MKLSNDVKKSENMDELKTETDHVKVNIEVTEFNPLMCGLESVDDIDDKLISYAERMIRGSYEYKQYISYLRSELDINTCALLKNINTKDIAVSLEIHHYPFTLYDIVTVLMTKAVLEKPENVSAISLFDIMSDVMHEHYLGNVGLVPLTASMHEMAHSGTVAIPYQKVYGNADAFALKYKKYISAELLDKLITAKAITTEDANDANKEKLTRTTLDYNIKYTKNENANK